MRPVNVILMLSLVPGLVSAHHSRAAYSKLVSELDGELIAVRWSNPHPRLTLKVVGDTGTPMTWWVEAWGSVYALQRSGVTRQRFKVGERLRIAGHVSTFNKGDFLGTNVMLASGTEVVLRRDAKPYWTADHVGSREQWDSDGRQPVDTAKENRGIFRVWSYPTPEFATKLHLPFTKAALDAKAAWDERDNYLTRCEAKGMPASMTTPHPYEFIDAGAAIKVRGHEFDIERTIYMNDLPIAEPPLHSRQGYSVGHWEGATLVVRTTHIDWPYFDMFGAPQSDQAEVVERYTLSSDQSRLDFHITVTDPVYFTEPATIDYYWIARGEPLGRYNCEVY